MRFTAQATAEQVKLARLAIAAALFESVDLVIRDRLHVALDEVKSGVRYKTVDWVTSMIADAMYTSRARGHADLAEKLHCVVHALDDIMSELDNF